MKPTTRPDVLRRPQARVDRPRAPRLYRITLTIAGWLVTTPLGGSTFTDSHAAAIERVAQCEAARLGGETWWPYLQDPRGGVLLVNAFTGQTRHFRTWEQAALFLAAFVARAGAIR